jgi:hypothetical protein
MRSVSRLATLSLASLILLAGACQEKPAVSPFPHKNHMKEEGF